MKSSSNNSKSQAKLQLWIENKKDYIEHMYEIMIPSMLYEFDAIYTSHKASPNVLRLFQNDMVLVQDWSKEQKTLAYSRLVSMSGCGYFADLVKGIIITSIKIHCISDDLGNIEVRIPSAEKFLHQCLINCARLIWKKPYLFYHNIRTIERQYNMNALEEICKKAIDRTLRTYIPLVDVLKSTVLSVADTTEESEDSSAAEEETESTDTSEESSDESEGEDEQEQEEEEEEEQEQEEEINDEEDKKEKEKEEPEEQDEDEEDADEDEDEEEDEEEEEEEPEQEEKGVEPSVDNVSSENGITIVYNAKVEEVPELAEIEKEKESGNKNELRNVIIDELLIPAKYRNTETSVYKDHMQDEYEHNEAKVDKKEKEKDDRHRSQHRSSRSRHHSPHKHSKPKVSNAFF